MEILIIVILGVALLICEIWRVMMTRNEIRKLGESLELEIDKLDIINDNRFGDLNYRIEKIENFKLKSGDIWISDNNNPDFPNSK